MELGDKLLTTLNINDKPDLLLGNISRIFLKKTDENKEETFLLKPFHGNL